MIARTLLGFLVLTVGSMSATLICPATANISNDCGELVTISTSNFAPISLAPSLYAYDVRDDVLSALFASDEDGICIFTRLAYCTTAATRYENALISVSGINAAYVTDDIGRVNVTGLAAEAATYFSLGSAPINGGNGGPEAATAVAFAGALAVSFTFASKKLRDAPPY